MSVPVADYPTRIWTGLSPDSQRVSREQNIEPSGIDYNQTIAEIRSMQSYVPFTILSQYSELITAMGGIGDTIPLDILQQPTYRGTKTIPVSFFDSFFFIKLQIRLQIQIDSDYPITLAFKVNNIGSNFFGRSSGNPFINFLMVDTDIVLVRTATHFILEGHFKARDQVSTVEDRLGATWLTSNTTELELKYLVSNFPFDGGGMNVYGNIWGIP